MEIKTDNSKVIDQLQKQNAEKAARIGRLEKAALISIHALSGGDAKAEVRDIYDETPAQSLQHIEAVVVEKYLPPVMQLTTVPVACREPADFMIGFNLCRYEIRRNAREPRQQQTNGSDK